MKKVLTVLALIAFTSSVYAASAWTKFTNSVDNGLNTITKKEQQLNDSIDKAQADRAKAKAEAKAKQDAQKAEAEKKVAAQKKAYTDTKKNIDEEVSFWKSLKFWK